MGGAGKVRRLDEPDLRRFEVTNNGLSLHYDRNERFRYVPRC